MVIVLAIRALGVESSCPINPVALARVQFFGMKRYAPQPSLPVHIEAQTMLDSLKNDIDLAGD